MFFGMSLNCFDGEGGEASYQAFNEKDPHASGTAEAQTLELQEDPGSPTGGNKKSLADVRTKAPQKGRRLTGTQKGAIIASQLVAFMGGVALTAFAFVPDCQRVGFSGDCSMGGSSCSCTLGSFPSNCTEAFLGGLYRCAFRLP